MDVSTFIDNAVQTLRDGFANINNPKGLLIALAATIFMGNWKQLIPIGLGATVVHLIVEVLAPTLSGRGGAVTLPSNLMQEDYWTRAGVLLVGYLVVIGIFFALKKLLFRGGGKGH